MRYVFIINPTAGKKDSTKNITESAKKALDPLGLEYKILVTERKGHARELAEREALSGDELTIFACGGDGTLNDIVSGAVGYDNVRVGVIPCGSGNDYIKLYGEKESFCDIAAQINGETHLVDIIKANERYSINICSIGLDAKVCHYQTGYKRIPFVSGRLSYGLALIRSLIGKLSTHLHITDKSSGRVDEGEYVFALAACGRVYGGGYIGAPEAIPNDGLMDITLFKKANHFQAPKLIGKYKSGMHSEIKEYIDSFRSRCIHIKAKKKLPVNVDGEVMYSDRITFESLPDAIKFIIPKGCRFEFPKKTAKQSA